MSTVKCCPNCFSELESYSRPCYFCGWGEFTRVNQLALPLNTVLRGRYVAGRVLGAGGFGITYKSYDMKARKICAIKEYVPANCAMRVTGSETLTISRPGSRGIYEHGKDKFLREADTLKQLTDIPDVVDVLDCFEENGTAYFVMEYLEGATLNRLRVEYGGRIPFKETGEIILKVAYCLAKIHEEGNIFHRDISPENIMITRNAEVKVIDFGTAKYIHNQKSQTLSVVLKPGYAPPEQYSTSSKQGAFTDVYALAATMYITLTGVKLHAAPDRVADEYFKPLEEYEFLGEKFEGLTEILRQALRPKANERTQTMREFADSLRQFYIETGVIDPFEDLTWFQPEDKDDSVTSQSKTSETPTGQGDISSGSRSTDKTVLVTNYVRPYLIGLNDPVRYRYDIPVNTLITVGRSSRSNIIVDLKSVSNKHLKFLYSTYEEAFIIQDNNSTNHTYINGKLCTPGEKYLAKPGSILSLAEGTCKFQLGIEEYS